MPFLGSKVNPSALLILDNPTLKILAFGFRIPPTSSSSDITFTLNLSNIVGSANRVLKSDMFPSEITAISNPFPFNLLNIVSVSGNATNFPVVLYRR